MKSRLMVIIAWVFGLAFFWGNDAASLGGDITGREAVSRFIREAPENRWFLVAEARDVKTALDQGRVLLGSIKDFKNCLTQGDGGCGGKMKAVFGDRVFVSALNQAYADQPVGMISQLKPREVTLEVTIYGKWAEFHPILEGHLVLYHRSRKAILWPAVRFDSVWQCGLFLHEVGHAKKDIVDKSSLALPPTHDLTIGEQIEMHDLTSEFLDCASQGKFLARVREIVGRKRVSGPEKVFDSISYFDLKDLDSLFGSVSGSYEAGLRALTYAYAISDQWVKSHTSRPDRLELERRRAYRPIMNFFMGFL